MHHLLKPLAIALFATFTVAPALAQAPAGAGKMQSNQAPAAPKADAQRDAAAATAKPRRAKVGKRSRRIAARHHRSRWRNVWVYRAHDRHGYRHYEYVSRKFGGYFARACLCRHHRHHHAGHWHM